MRINHNIAALNTYSRLGQSTTAQSKSLEKLSSGLRINRAGDDAAGLAISEKMRGQIRGLDQAARNAQDGISMIQTAEGALNETHSILQRMRELSVQASNDTNTDTDRDEIQKEMTQLTSELSRIGNTTEFNAKNLLDGNLEAVNAATQETFTLDFTDYASAADSGTVELSIGGETYTINFADTSAGNSYNALTQVISIDTNANNIDVGDDIIDELQRMRGEDPALQISEFTFTKSGGTTLTIATTADGAYDGAAGDGSISVDTGLDAGHISQGAAGSDGTTGSAQLQVGANNGQRFEVAISDMRALALVVSGTSGAAHGSVADAVFTTTDELDQNSGAAEYALDLSDSDKATAAVEVVDDAIKTVSAERSKLGAFQNRLEHTINNLSTSSENLTAAESRIRDVDMAKEMMEFTKNNILNQAATSMLAQANQQPQGVLQLLR